MISSPSVHDVAEAGAPGPEARLQKRVDGHRHGESQEPARNATDGTCTAR